MKSKLLLTAFFIALTFQIQAQEDAWVYFKDKPSASTYLSNPLLILSQRSLDRRALQNLPLDISDAPVETSYVSQIKNATGINVMAKSKWLNALHIRGSQTAIEALTAFTFVNNIDFANHSLNPNGRIANPISYAKVTNKLETQTDYNYGNSANQIQMLNGHLLHQQNYKGQGKIIAVFDAGFPGVNTAASFQKLRDDNLLLGGYNFPDRNEIIYTRNSHGTNVLSTMGGYVSGQLVGTAPEASYYLFITEDIYVENPIEESYWVEAAEMADSLGVDVINSSLGYTDYDNPNYSYTYGQKNGQVAFASRGAAMLQAKGIVAVISAGNSGTGGDPTIGIPSDADNVLTIGAVNSSEVRASFSSIGPSADGRIKPDVCAKGVEATVSNTAGAITVSNGTSFSSPILAGMVATFWSAVPNLTAQQVIEHVKKSADQYSNPDNLKGYGVPDFQLALNNALSIKTFETIPFSIYPNPVSNTLFVQKHQNLNAEFTIYTIFGQIVSKTQITQNNQEINLNQLANAIYYYEYANANSTFKGKIIKN